MNQIRAIVLAALVFMVAFSAMPVPASAQANSEITSCQTITESGTYQITNEISGSGTCIDIQVESGESVVIEGNGYRIVGDGNGTAIGGAQGVDVTVRNVEVSNWEVGVTPNSSNLFVEDSLISANQRGIEYESESANVELVRTEVSGNTEWGVYMIAGSFVATDGRISNNGNGSFFVGGENADMTGTTISNNDDVGVYLGHYMQATLTDVTIEGNGVGIKQFMHGSTLNVEGSSITGNDGAGIDAAESDHELYLTDTTIQNNGGQEIRSYDDGDGAVVEAQNVDLGGGVELETYGSRLNVELESSQHETDAVTLEGSGATFYFTTNSEDAELLERTGGSWEQHSTYENTGGTFEATVNPGTYAGDSYEMSTPTPTEEQTPTPTEEQTPTPTEEQTPTPTEEQTPTPTDEQTPTRGDSPTPTQTEEQTPTRTEEQTPTRTEEQTPTRTEEQTPTQTEEQTPTEGQTTPQQSTPTPTDEQTPTRTEEQTPTQTDGGTATPMDPVPTVAPTETETETQTDAPTETETRTGTETETTTRTTTVTGTPTETMNATNTDQAGQNGDTPGDGRLRWIAIGLAILLLLALAVVYLVDWEKYRGSYDDGGFQFGDRRR